MTWRVVCSCLSLVAFAMVGCQSTGEALRSKGAPTTQQVTQTPQRHHVRRVVSAIKQVFPKVALSHVSVTYDYSLLRNKESILVESFSFYLPTFAVPTPKVLRQEIRAVLKAIGRTKVGCLNVDVSKQMSRFAGYQWQLKQIKVDFACG